MNPRQKHLVIMALVIVTSLSIHLISIESFSQKNDSIVKEDLAMREYMLDISRQLGVTCNYCHNVKDYKDTSMSNYQIAKQHMRVVHLLNTEGFVGKNAIKVDCYMCHQGKAKYQHKMPEGI